MPSAFAQTSSYASDYTLADYRGVTPTGGTIIVPMVLTSGAPVAGLGASFDVVFTLSPLSTLNPPTNYFWAATPNSTYPDYSYNFPTNIYEGLPATNLTPAPRTINGVTYNQNTGLQWMVENFEEGNFAFVGSFTVTSSLLPSTPGYNVVSEMVEYGQSWNFVFDDNWVYGGMGSVVAGYEPYFGGVNTYAFMGLNAGEQPAINPAAPMFFGDASVTFEVIPEPGSLSLVLLTGSLLFATRRRR